MWVTICSDTSLPKTVVYLCWTEAYLFTCLCLSGPQHTLTIVRHSDGSGLLLFA